VPVRIVLSTLVSVIGAAACECVLPPPKIEMKHSDVVFRGIITDVNDKEIVFAVQRVYKGQVFATFPMPNVRFDADCAPGFRRRLVKVGNELFVYARWEPFFSKGPVTNDCSRTRLIETASEDLGQLGRGRKPTR